jgi:hypothetical protein
MPSAQPRHTARTGVQQPFRVAQCTALTVPCAACLFAPGGYLPTGLLLSTRAPTLGGCPRVGPKVLASKFGFMTLWVVPLCKQEYQVQLLSVQASSTVA